METTRPICLGRLPVHERGGIMKGVTGLSRQAPPPRPEYGSVKIWLAVVLTLGSLLWTGFALADEEDAPSLVGDGYRFLDCGDDVRAEEAFSAALSLEPDNLEALEGLVWTYVYRGDFEQAAEAADARLALDPDGSFTSQWLSIIGMVPSRREEVVAVYQEQIAADPGALEPHLRLAQLLSWTPSRREEAIAVYQQALAIEPTSIEARVGLASVLSWVGERAEANEIFDAILAEQPDNLEALLGRARSARWTGDWESARRFYDRALEVAPHAPLLFAERVQFELDPALRAAEIALAEELAARSARRRETMTQIGLYPTASRDSAGFERWNVRLEGVMVPLDSTRLRLVSGWTRFRDDAEQLDRLTFGGEARQGLPFGFFLRGLYLAQLYKGAPNAHEFNAEAGLHNPDWPIQFRMGFWQHANVDQLNFDEQAFSLEGVGAGGLTVAGIREDIQVRDLYLAVSGSPFSGSYFYSNGAFGWMNDGNRRIVTGGGLGVDVLNIARLGTAHELFVKYDFYLLAYERERPLYWTPAGFQTHTPGLAWNWRSNDDRWFVGIELGAPIDPEDGSVGYLVGAFGRYQTAEHWCFQVRAIRVDDTEFAMTAGTAGLVFGF